MLQRKLFEAVPFNVAVIDRDFNVVVANSKFEEYFGDWRGRKCYEVYKRQSEPCPNCKTGMVFKDGRVRVSDETGIDRHDRTCHYVGHVAPLRDENGEIICAIEMTTDITETKSWQRQYDVLFERVPCYITVIDRNYRIIRSNEKFRNAFGDSRGKFCYEVYKRRKTPCQSCTAALTFDDGKEHVSTHVGVTRTGAPAHYIVNTSPLSRGESGIAHVIEIATDVSEVKKLELELRQAHDMLSSLIQNSTDGIIALDNQDQVQMINRAARDILEWKAPRKPTEKRLREMLPIEFFEDVETDGILADFAETNLKSASGEDIPARFRAVELKSRQRNLGKAAFISDLRDIKRLEHEKLDAERLAAVGQTVAGLAHTIKNILMGLEGGMYMVDSGLKKSDAKRIIEGWDVLQRNFNKTTTLVKDFLSFSKGRLPDLKPVEPEKLVNDIVALYKETAFQQGVQLLMEPVTGVRSALLDPDGMEACLTNLVSNAIDAARLREGGGGIVTIRTLELDNDLIFEVVDNGIGMDMEIKQNVFTTFFTTKGGKGTGLGLLTTRKIIQEHGGTIELESDPGAGSTFRIRLPRRRLEMLAASTKNKNN